MLSLIAGGFAVAATLRLRGEEAGGRPSPAGHRTGADPLGCRICSWLGGSALMAAAGLGMGLTYGVTVGKLGQRAAVVGAAVAFVPALWVLVGVTLVLFGFPPRAARPGGCSGAAS